MDHLYIHNIPEVSFPPQRSFVIRQASSDSTATAASWNHLWLLFLIPVVLVACVIILVVWLFNRKRRQRLARKSALRNVTLVILDEEKARDREERRLSRANSAMSRLGRRQSSMKERREKRYGQRVSKAVAREEKMRQQEPVGVGAGDLEEQAPILSRALSDATKDPLRRKASVKHRDREVVERVWRIAGEDMGDSPMPTAAAHPRELDRLIEGASGAGAFADNSKRYSLKPLNEPKRQAAEHRENYGDIGEETAGSTYSLKGHTRDNSHPLSMIGETSLSEDRTGDAMMGVSDLAPVASASRSEIVPSPLVEEGSEGTMTPSQSPEKGLAYLNTQIRPSEASWLSRSNSRISSIGSGYASAASRLTSPVASGREGIDRDTLYLQSMGSTEIPALARGLPGQFRGGEEQTMATNSLPSAGKTGRPVQETMAASGNIDFESGDESATTTQSSEDPFKSPVKVWTEGSANPFTSPIWGSANHHLLQFSSPLPAANSVRATAIASAAPALITTVPSPGYEEAPDTRATIPDSPPTAKPLSQQARKWSNAIRLKTPTPTTGRRNRSASPGGVTTPPIGRSAGSFKLNRSISAKSASSAKSARHNKAPILLPSSHALHKTHSLSNVRFVPGTGSNSAALRRAASNSAAQSKSQALPPESWAYTSRAAEWRKAVQPKKAAAAEQRPGSSPKGNTSTISAPGGDDLTIPQSSSRPLERKPSIGIAGSRFKEAFE